MLTILGASPEVPTPKKLLITWVLWIHPGHSGFPGKNGQQRFVLHKVTTQVSFTVYVKKFKTQSLPLNGNVN